MLSTLCTCATNQWPTVLGHPPNLSKAQRTLNTISFGHYTRRKAKQIWTHLPRVVVATSDKHSFNPINESNRLRKPRHVYVERVPLSSLEPDPNSRCALLNGKLAEAPPVSHWRIVVRANGLDPGIVWEIVSTEEEDGRLKYQMTKVGGIADLSDGQKGGPKARNGGRSTTQPAPVRQNRVPSNTLRPEPPERRKWKSTDGCWKCLCPLSVPREPYVLLPADHLLGSTTMTDKEINDAAWDIVKELRTEKEDLGEKGASLAFKTWAKFSGASTKQMDKGNYNLLWRNCQVFAIEMAFMTVGTSWLERLKLNVYFNLMPSSINLLCCQKCYP